MKGLIASALLLLCGLPLESQNVPDGWHIVRDAQAVCQIAVPPDWVPLADANGAAVLHDSSTAIAVVTSQPGQEFKPLTTLLLKAMGLPKDQIFENSATRIFYQDKTSRGAEDPVGFSSSVPARSGTCSCHVQVLPAMSEQVARKIALSVSPAPPKT